jgi:hypothetical protein
MQVHHRPNKMKTYIPPAGLRVRHNFSNRLAGQEIEHSPERTKEFSEQPVAPFSQTKMLQDLGLLIEVRVGCP